jgi:hypothetical protein
VQFRQALLRLILPLAAAALACNLPESQPTEDPVPTWAVPSRQTATALADFVESTETAEPALPTDAPTATVEPAPPLAEGEFRAARVQAPPTVDGSLDDWAELPYSANQPVFGQSSLQGTEDLSAAWNIGWDDDNLYLAVEARDDLLVQRSHGEQIFRGDSVELLLDTDLESDPGVRRLDADDFQLGFSPGNPAGSPPQPEAYLWFPQASAGPLSNVPVASQWTGGGYRLEAAVPWARFNVNPEAGQRFGFALSLSDDDTSASAEQESMVSSSPGRILADPTTWGVLELGS